MLSILLRSRQRPSLEVATRFLCDLSLQPQSVYDVWAQNSFVVVCLLCTPKGTDLHNLTGLFLPSFTPLKWFTFYSSSLWFLHFSVVYFSQRLSFMLPSSQNALALINGGSLQTVLWPLFLLCLKYFWIHNCHKLFPDLGQIFSCPASCVLTFKLACATCRVDHLLVLKIT